MASSRTPEAHYYQLGQLIAEMPDFGASPKPSPEKRTWAGRAVAILEASDDINDKVDSMAVARACEYLEHAADGVRVANANKVARLLYRALGRAEAKLPAAAQGAFLPAGDTFEAFAAVGKILVKAQSNVLMVDPYADVKIISDFAAQVAESVLVRILSDTKRHKPSLKPAMEQWLAKYAATRPLEVRLAAHTLHDRLIIIDDAQAWSLGQSFKDLAANAPTTITITSPEAAKSKIEGYAEIWDSATAI